MQLVVPFAVPVSTAFTYLSDPRNRPEWQSSLRSVEMKTGGPPRVGMGWIDHTKVGLHFPLEITALDSDRLWAERGGFGPFDATVVLEFAEVNGGCNVTADVRLQLRGPRITDLVSRPATHAAVLAAGGDLRRAARILEQQGG
jgi:hypothetical protein